MVMMGEMLRRAKTDRTTLAQCISIVQSRAHGEQARDLLDAIASELDIYATTSMRLGICGSPGSGKSSLIEAVGSHYLQADQRARLAVLACDPTSVASGGSLMGDCTRMPRLVSEERCFLRPTPTPTLGATSSVVSSAWDTLTLFSYAGYQLQIVESVGSGQMDVAFADLVDVVLYATSPHTGDWLQAMKGGVTETCDAVALCKCDLPGGELAVSEWQAGTAKAILPVSALTGQGIAELWRFCQQRHADLTRTGELREQRRQQFQRWVHRMLVSELTEKVAHMPVDPGMTMNTRRACETLMQEVVGGKGRVLAP